MGVSRLSKKCENKRMEALAYLPEPILRETMEIHVDGKTLTVYKDEIENKLLNSLYTDLVLPII